MNASKNCKTLQIMMSRWEVEFQNIDLTLSTMKVCHIRSVCLLVGVSRPKLSNSYNEDILAKSFTCVMRT